ncbi:flavin mononucleotide phosphatase YbjI [Clostridium puniceum]|uniref:Flavin mononucleotide phosphatase YbjI n=1 Tax=Clostridium puniceum TaxID=29367 RepID=A0A1S8T9L8_9CLOT|nr:Cof-type HAD-IIB family hydrolase [Clostridium puniceum]OOM74453.1 flavin mononucleotide phosphatase YbjI [Clostridium puniceum]
MIKLIVTDMDGTLLDENGHLPDGFTDILDRLRANDIKLVAASGRPYYTLQTNFGPIGKYLSFICENGALVVDNSKVTYESVIDNNIVAEVLDTSKQIDNNVIILCSANCAYVENCSEEHLSEIKKYYTSLEIVDDLTKVTNPIYKITICNLENSHENLNTFFKPKFKDKLNVVGSGEIWIDISNKNANKGTALQSLMNTYNVSKEETMVFGDYYNDIEMLEQAEYSFVMENAPEDMKQYGKYIAASNKEHGVLRAILEYAL